MKVGIDADTHDNFAMLNADVVVHGHVHEPEIRPGRPLVVKPGSTDWHKIERPQVAILDTDAEPIFPYERGRGG